MQINGVTSQNFNGIFSWFLYNYELGSRIDPDSNPLGWQDEIRSLSTDSYTPSSDSYTPSATVAKSASHESSLLESVKSLTNAANSSTRKELLIKIRNSVDDMIKSIK